MTLDRSYRFSLAWLSFVALLSAVDLGIAVGRWQWFIGAYPTNVLAVAEVLVHTAVVVGLRSRVPRGWLLAIIWIPSWILFSSYDIYAGGELVLSFLWTPLFLGSAVAHRVLLQERIREAYGVGQRWARWLRWSPALTFVPALFVPLSLSLGTRLAGALSLSFFVIGATAPAVYGTFEEASTGAQEAAQEEVAERAGDSG